MRKLVPSALIFLKLSNFIILRYGVFNFLSRMGSMNSFSEAVQEILLNNYLKVILKTQKLEILSARLKTRKPRKSQKSQKFFSDIFKSEFLILAVGQNRKLGKKKTRNNFSEISDFSEFSICHFFIFFFNSLFFFL